MRLNVPVNNVSVIMGLDFMCLGGGGSMYTQENMSVKHIPGGIKCAPLKQNWGMQGYTYFAYFAPKHRLWVLVRTASLKFVEFFNFHS